VKDKSFLPTDRRGYDLLAASQPPADQAVHDETSGSPYVCPGSNVAVSRAVHLARLNAAWCGCDQCDWRDDTEGLASRSAADTQRIRTHRSDGIQRTESGVRGQYINHLNRRVTARLIQVFCSVLARTEVALPSSSRVPAPGSDRTDPGLNPNPAARHLTSRGFAGRPAAVSPESLPDQDQPRQLELPSVILGYDGRPPSPDLFVGAVSAVREYGLPVIDIGRCTAGSILEAIRCFPEAAGGVLVTGSGMPPAWTGFDVFDQHGDSVPVVWKDHGIRLQSVELVSDDLPDRRSAGATADARDTGSAAPAPRLLLTLPSEQTRHSPGRRISRTSGALQTIDFETRYRSWLTRWYPRESQIRLAIRSDDVLVLERLQWLSRQIGFQLQCRGTADRCEIHDAFLTMTIEDDDRRFHVQDSAGVRVGSSELAAYINAATGPQSSQVTAHADAVSNRFWLTDTGRPTSGRSTEHIEDGLATLGLLLRLQHPR
jgi:hypothetical protein